MNRKIGRSVAAAFLFGPHLLAAGDARAVGPVDVEVAVRVGYGTNPSSSPINPVGSGYGLRGGVVFRGFYGGLSVMHYAGDPKSYGNASQSVDLLGLEAGYGFKIAIVTLRPQIGIGVPGLESSESCALAAGPGLGCGSPYVASLGGPYVEPGLTVLVAIQFVIIGGDVNALVFLGDPSHASLTAHLQVGVRF